jgi:hypothetical protein
MHTIVYYHTLSLQAQLQQGILIDGVPLKGQNEMGQDWATLTVACPN